MIAVLLSCKQNGGVKQVNPADQYQIDTLIVLGKEYPGNVDSLLSVSKKLTLLTTATGDKKALVYGEMFTAQYYWLTASHKKSMEIAVKCLADAGRWNIQSAYPAIYFTISNLDKENTDYQLAFDAAEKGMYWAKANKDTGNMILFYGMKGMLIHTQQEALHGNLNDTSINLQFTGLKIAESKPGYERLRIPYYDNIAQYYLDNKDYKKTIYYGNKGAALALKNNRLRSLTYSYTWLGYAWYHMGDKQKGLGYLNKALLIASTLKLPYREMEMYNSLYDLYYKDGNYKKAIDMNRRSMSMQDSLRVLTNEQQISELQIKYESAKKDKEIVLMDHTETVKDRQIFTILAGSLLGVIFFIILFLQYRIIRRNHNLITISNEKKDQALVDIAFIQTHELRKPLASIMGLINVIKSTDSNLDQECLAKLEEASKELDDKIHDVLSHVTEAK